MKRIQTCGKTYKQQIKRIDELNNTLLLDLTTKKNKITKNKILITNNIDKINIVTTGNRTNATLQKDKPTT